MVAALPILPKREPQSRPEMSYSATVTATPDDSPAVRRTEDVRVSKERRGGRVALQIAAVLVCLGAWYVVTLLKLNLGLITFHNVPSPVDVARGGWEFLTSSAATKHVLASIRRVGIGFGLATVVGVVTGMLAGRYWPFRNVVMPPLEIIRPIPAVAWIPLAILMFPSSEASMIFITFLGALFPILLNTIHGAEAVDPRLVASARSLGAGGAQTFREVIFPGALPNIITGLVIGIGTAWFCLVTAEMISGQFGIGYFTWMSYTVQDYPGTVVGMILIGILGLGSSLLVRRLGDAATPWRRLDRKAR
jgi:NitT/TauT family transport system permease protein